MNVLYKKYLVFNWLKPLAQYPCHANFLFCEQNPAYLRDVFIYQRHVSSCLCQRKKFQSHLMGAYTSRLSEHIWLRGTDAEITYVKSLPTHGIQLLLGLNSALFSCWTVSEFIWLFRRIRLCTLYNILHQSACVHRLPHSLVYVSRWTVVANHGYHSMYIAITALCTLVSPDSHGVLGVCLSVGLPNKQAEIGWMSYVNIYCRTLSLKSIWFLLRFNLLIIV